jgi:hypothetical protein
MDAGDELKKRQKTGGTRRNDTGKNYLAISNLYRPTLNLTERDSPHL